MTSTDLILTLLVGALAAGVSFVATPLAGKLAGILRMQDRPAERKLHAGLVPYLGGLAILSGWIIAFLTPGTLAESVVLMAAMGALGTLGFVDDRHDISPRLRLVIQIAIAVAAYAGGIRMTPTQEPIIDFALTILWLVGMTNAFNFMDNMDGLAAGVGGIGAAFLGLSGVLFGQNLVSILGFGLAGSCLGFLRHNFHPARIFMGDTGSLPLGFGLAAVAIKVKFPGVHPLIAFSVPVMTLGLFVVDTCVMALGRVQRGEPVVGGRLDHLSHRLLVKNLPVKNVAIRMYGAALVFGVSGLIASQLPAPAGGLIIFAVAGASVWGAVTALRWPILRGLVSNDDLVGDVAA
ncbi:MAG: undecaprenyl/decaprenyl-phosphate alpha-N-acetylglucosaminyl 1-phosphate transferase [Actinomycetota bacterium]|nr:undecaprenyl/decaprenyl-phosphate alpha-N-acetylglucosaminyl 1-phosphate transferase [Actinomycetota bacterium]